MMSTPISSSRAAISSFSSCVIVAPGDCSPSRRVVSNIRTRSWVVLSVMMNCPFASAFVPGAGHLRAFAPEGHAQRRLRRRSARGLREQRVPWAVAMIGSRVMNCDHTERGRKEKTQSARCSALPARSAKPPGPSGAERCGKAVRPDPYGWAASCCISAACSSTCHIAAIFPSLICMMSIPSISTGLPDAGIPKNSPSCRARKVQ